MPFPRITAVALSLILGSLGLATPAAADMTIGSWNLKHLGWNNDKRIDMVVEIAQGADLWALQEVMDADAVVKLEQRMEEQTGEHWSSMASHEVGRSSYKENYAFLWRDSKVEYTKGAVVYLDPGDLFAREPYLAEFRDKKSGKTVAMATVHIVYGGGRSDRTPEIRELASIWEWMHEVYPGSPRLIAGDFNLVPGDPAWQPLRNAGARPAITSGATTLSSHDGKYANLYDNFWYDPQELDATYSGIVRYPEKLGLTHVQARDMVSDHAPVYFALDDLAPGFAKTADMSLAPSGVETSTECFDLNVASVSELDELPNIGPARAQDIINGRPWGSVDELTRIDGIGLARMRQIKDSGLICM